MDSIDLARYEGHTKAPWQDNGFTVCMGGLWTSDQDIIATVNEEVGDMDGFADGVVASANARLIADAPLLLAEVRRLTAELADADKRLDMLTQDGVTVEEFEMQMRNGVFTAILTAGGEGSSTRGALRLLGGAMLHVLMGDQNTMPPNYQTAEMTLKLAGAHEPLRLSLTVIKPGGKSPHAMRETAEAELAAIRKAAREYLAVSVPECAETGADLGRESWTPGFRAKFEALEQLAKEG